ncbi:beta-hexosaminidase 1 isoform X1 [Curcuma longa]|uniref:beta-hexosaminidase 1 isoform X1 n=1 Tax=Curcuma longa TaxID=136217 RepID=UPI003D9F0490
MPSEALRSLLLLLLLLSLLTPPSHGRSIPARYRIPSTNDSPVYLWPLPKQFSHGDGILYVDPDLSLDLQVPGDYLEIVSDAFERYKDLIFTHRERSARRSSAEYDVAKVTVIVSSTNDTQLQFGVDESYMLYVGRGDGLSVVKGATIEANTIYGALRGLETFSQLCIPNYENKSVEIQKAPWLIKDEPRFNFRGLLIDTSRHYLPVNVIKQVIEAMSYAKLNVLHWHILDEESFPLEVPSYPNLWKGSFSKLERYTIEDAYEVVDFAKKRGIHIMAEVDVPGHAESWGSGYPDLWPSANCTEPLDVSKNYTFEVISGILSDMRKIFPFGLFHLGGDEVNTDCWSSTPHVKQWLQERNMTTKEAYQYFVLRAQKIAAALGWIPVNWEETFNTFNESLNPQTVVHNWWGPGVCPEVVEKGFRCIVSNQGVWYLDHLDIPWEDFYTSEPLEGINNTTQQNLVLGGEVCMWGETADTSVVQQTIWPRAAAAAERLWSPLESTSTGNLNTTVLQRLHYFRCLLNRRGIAAAPVTNKYARSPPYGPGSCYVQ